MTDTKTYTITATLNGADCSTPEVLGDTYGRTYPSAEAATVDALELGRTLTEYGLHPSTEYRVTEG